MTKAQLPRKRACKPKVQTGCMQCKRIKVKCPEQRPVCARCQRLALNCCYVPPKPKQADVIQNEDKARPIRQILPASATAVGLLPPSPQPSWCGLVPGGGMYFDCFRYQVVLMNQDIEMTDFWLRTVLRASPHDESITYAITAIGALARTRKKARSIVSFQNPDLSDQEGRAHYRAAIKYYSKSIATFRSYLTRCPKPEDAYRTILIITILFIVFEILHGNSRAADTLTANGILLLKDKILHSINRTSRSSLAGSLDDQGILEAELFLARSATLCSKASYLMPYANAEGIKAMQMIPSSCLNVAAPPDGDVGIKELSFQFLQVLTPLLVWHTRVGASRIMGISVSDHPMLLQQQSLLLIRLRKWIDAYQIQLKKKHAIHISDYLEWQSILTRLGYIVVYCELDATGTLWDSMGDECLQLIPMFRAHFQAQLVNQSMSGDSLISLEVSSMWGIVVAAAVNVATECRDRSARLGLIDLCMLATNNSSLRHLRSIVVATAMFIEMEEEGRDKAGVIPLSSRYELETAMWDDNTGQVRLNLITKAADLDGKRKKRELVCHLKDHEFV